jgi:hypothetical protein
MYTLATNSALSYNGLGTTTDPVTVVVAVSAVTMPCEVLNRAARLMCDLAWNACSKLLMSGKFEGTRMSASVKSSKSSAIAAESYSVRVSMGRVLRLFTNEEVLANVADCFFIFQFVAGSVSTTG